MPCFDTISSQDLARGAVLLGTGGGGDPHVGELFLRRQLQRGLQPRLLPLAELADEAFVVRVAGIGAPTVLVEHLLSETALKHLLRQAEALYGRPIDALVCAEVGGANAMLPLAAAALSGLPLVDADGIGRAFPHIDMTTFGIHGCNASPALFSDDLGNLAHLSAADNPSLERMVRALAVELSPAGVRVNAIAPGWIRSDISDNALNNDPDRKNKILSRTPMHRIGDPDDIAYAAVYLASPAARFVTGTTLVVDGGISVGF